MSHGRLATTFEPLHLDDLSEAGRLILHHPPGVTQLSRVRVRWVVPLIGQRAEIWARYRSPDHELNKHRLLHLMTLLIQHARLEQQPRAGVGPQLVSVAKTVARLEQQGLRIVPCDALH